MQNLDMCDLILPWALQDTNACDTVDREDLTRVRHIQANPSGPGQPVKGRVMAMIRVRAT